MTEFEKIRYLIKIKRKKAITRSQLQILLGGHYWGELIDSSTNKLFIDTYDMEYGPFGMPLEKPTDHFKLTDDGHNFLRAHKNFIFTQKIPVCIAAAALAVSIIALVFSIISFFTD